MGNPRNWNKTTPAAPSGKGNVVFQQASKPTDPQATRDTSGYYENTIPANSDVAISGLTDGDVLTYRTGSGNKWINQAPSGGGGGSVPSGSPVVLGIPGGTNNSNWSDFSVRVRIPHTGLLCIPTSWKVRLMFTGGTGVHISKAQIKRTLKNSTAVIDSTNFTFNSGSMPYNFAFGVTASTSAPVYLDSDAIALALDADHNYWIYLYFDNDSGGSNFNSSVGFNQSASPSIDFSLGNSHTSGDQTGDTTVPGVATTMFLVTQVLAS